VRSELTTIRTTRIVTFRQHVYSVVIVSTSVKIIFGTKPDTVFNPLKAMTGYGCLDTTFSIKEMVVFEINNY